VGAFTIQWVHDLHPPLKLAGSELQGQLHEPRTRPPALRQLVRALLHATR